MAAKLISILAQVLDMQEDQIDDSSSMETIESWDSLKHIELVLSIEEHYDVALTLDEIVEMKSVIAIKQMLKEKGIAF